MSFLLRCVFWFGLVLLAIGGRNAEPPGAPAAEARPREREIVLTKGQSAGARRTDVISAFTDQAASRLASAARDHCLAHPLDCLLAADNMSLGPAKPEPARR